jgi:hypothetical protein
MIRRRGSKFEVESNLQSSSKSNFLATGDASMTRNDCHEYPTILDCTLVSFPWCLFTVYALFSFPQSFHFPATIPPPIAVLVFVLGGLLN